jgi:hypothetical protein
MQRRAVGFQKVLLAASTLELTPPPAVGIAIGSQIASPHPAIIDTARLGTELPRGVHLVRPSLCRGKQRGWGKLGWGWSARLRGLLTSSTAGSVGDARKRLGLLGVLAERCGRLAGGQAGRGLVSCPPFVQDDAEPQEGAQQEVIEKEVVYHGVFLLFGANEDRPPDAQAGDLSARWRYTPPSADCAVLSSWCVHDSSCLFVTFFPNELKALKVLVGSLTRPGAIGAKTSMNREAPQP